jgi:uncharacterized protein YndB with AHSA1/START domain
MPTFSLDTWANAPIEEVWKLLHDPSRFPEWWTGVETVRRESPDSYTMWPAGYPDFPMAQRLRAEPGAGRVTISCLVSDLEFTWRLEEDALGTIIVVDVEIPESEGHRLRTQKELITTSLNRLVALAVATQ